MWDRLRPRQSLEPQIPLLEIEECELSTSYSQEWYRDLRMLKNFSNVLDEVACFAANMPFFSIIAVFDRFNCFIIRVCFQNVGHVSTNLLF